MCASHCPPPFLGLLDYLHPCPTAAVPLLLAPSCTTALTSSPGSVAVKQQKKEHASHPCIPLTSRVQHKTNFKKKKKTNLQSLRQHAGAKKLLAQRESTPSDGARETARTRTMDVREGSSPVKATRANRMIRLLCLGANDSRSFDPR